MDPVGRALEQAKRDSEEAAALGRLRIKLREPLSHLGGPPPSRRASEPAGRALDPVGRASKKAKTSEGAIKGGPVGDNDLWYHHIEKFSPFFKRWEGLIKLEGLRSSWEGVRASWEGLGSSWKGLGAS